MNDQAWITDFLVETTNAERLDDILQQAPGMTARVMGRGRTLGITTIEGYPVVRVWGNTSWFRFFVQEQGCCTIMKQLESPAPESALQEP